LSFHNENKNRLADIGIEIHRDLIELSKLGDASAQTRLYHNYARAMLNTCYRLVNHKEEAEDLLQEIFTEAFMKLDKFRYESTFGAWLKRITVNRCINHLKRKRVPLILTEEITQHEGTSHEDVQPSDLEVEKIRKAMHRLPDGFRMVFSLYLLEGYDHEEISQILGISVSTSKSQYSRAKQKIRQLIKDES